MHKSIFLHRHKAYLLSFVKPITTLYVLLNIESTCERYFLAVSIYAKMETLFRTDLLIR